MIVRDRNTPILLKRVLKMGYAYIDKQIKPMHHFRNDSLGDTQKKI